MSAAVPGGINVRRLLAAIFAGRRPSDFNAGKMPAVIMLYPLFLLLNALEMLAELRISMRNSQALSSQGAIEIEPRILQMMTLLYVLMYPACFLEYWFVSRSVQLIWLSVFIAAKLLKLWAFSSLGRFWTMRVLIVPQSKTVKTGPYRWLRHPNYVAVLMEISATCLLGKCFFTFLVITGLFAALLVWRIRTEEAALRRYTDYR
jgi:methyltransferase